MDLFTYLLGKNGKNTHRDLFSYLLGKNAGGSGTYTTFSGTSLNISNTLQAKIKNIALEGNTSQNGEPTPDTPIPIKIVTGEQSIEISGKNLFNLYDHKNTLDDYTTIISPNKYTCNASSTWEGRVIVPISNFKKNTDYTFSYISNSTRTYINEIRGIKDGVTTTIYNGAYYQYVKKITFNTSDYDKIVIDMYARGNGGTATQVTISNLQLEEGSQATEFVPYQSQNYPISLSSKNLLNIANYNGTINNLNIKSENQQIAINGTANSGTYTWIVITKDNFFTRNGTPSASAIVDYANGKIISTGIVGKLKEVISGTSTVDFGINLYDENGTVVSTPIETTNIIAIGMYLGNGQTFNNYKFGIQLEKGSTATPYEPYYNIEYCKIGDYADQIFKNTTDSEFYDSTLELNEWYLKKNIGKFVLNGSESGWTNVGGNAPYKYTNSNIKMSSSESNNNLLSNYYPCKKWSDSWSSFDYMVVQTRNGQSIQFRNVNISTLEDFKDWLSTHNTKVYYPLATPTYTHISQEDYPTLKAQLDNLYNNSKSYNGQTNITQTNDDLSFNISVDVKVTSTNLGMSNSLNAPLNTLDNVNEINEIEEPIENEEVS